MGWEREIGGKPAGTGLIPVRDDGWIFINAPGRPVPCSLCPWQLGSRLLLGYVSVGLSGWGSQAAVGACFVLAFHPGAHTGGLCHVICIGVELLSLQGRLGSSLVISAPS